MPRRPRKAIARRNNSKALTPDQEENLLKGHSFEELLDDGIPAFSEDEDPEELYWKHRDYLLSQCEPGHRPAAYWKFECKEPRQLVSGDPQFTHTMISASGNGLLFCTDGKTRTQKDLPLYENDYQILTRLELLGEGEADEYEEAKRLEAERKTKIIRFPLNDGDTEDEQ